MPKWQLSELCFAFQAYQLEDVMVPSFQTIQNLRLSKSFTLRKDHISKPKIMK